MESELVRELRDSIGSKRSLAAQGKPWVYLVGEDKIAKGYSIKSSMAEFRWGRYLNSKGLNVPKMHDLVGPDYVRGTFYKPAITEWFVVMQRIRGREMQELSPEESRNAMRLYRQELCKVLDLGLFPDDVDWCKNCIFGDDGKLYLIDLEYWKRGTPQQIEKVRKKIDCQDFSLRSAAN